LAANRQRSAQRRVPCGHDGGQSGLAAQREHAASRHAALRRGCTGVPNAWDFYHVADNATEKDQDLFISASIDNQTTASFHNTLRYGATRKREQYNQWAQEGGGDDATATPLGNLLTITGANGYSVRARPFWILPEVYPNGYQQVSNRDQLTYQGDYKFTPHLIALIGFHYEDERATLVDPSYAEKTMPTSARNYDYLASVHGDFKGRFFYTRWAEPGAQFALRNRDFAARRTLL
jgi:vitamin B12 transporter